MECIIDRRHEPNMEQDMKFVGVLGLDYSSYSTQVDNQTYSSLILEKEKGKK